MTRLWSGAVPATDDHELCGSVSPSRPSTHRSRVPTAFLALDQGECKVAHTVRSPSRTTSVSRSAPSGLAACIARHPTRMAFTSAHVQITLAQCPLSVPPSAGHRALAGTQLRFRASRSRRRSRLRPARRSVPIGRPPLQHHRAQEGEQRLPGSSPSVSARPSSRCAESGPRPPPGTGLPSLRNAGRRCLRRRLPVGRSHRSAPRALLPRKCRRRPPARGRGCGPRPHATAGRVETNHTTSGIDKPGRAFRIVVINRSVRPV